MNEMHSKASKSIAKRVIDLLSSYGFAVVILTLLLLLTLFGTLEQAEFGIFEVQRKYFDSTFLIHRLFGAIPIPLPGAFLLLVLLFVNITLGGIIRAPKHWRYPGMLIAHSGIIILLAAGFVTFHFSTTGNLRLFEGQASNRFQSYYDWVIEIRRLEPEPDDDVLVIPTRDLESIRRGAARTFVSDRLPFDVIVAGYAPNTRPAFAHNAPFIKAVDGVYLETLPRDAEAEMNVAGAHVTLAARNGGPAPEGLLWGQQLHPFTARIGDALWAVYLTRRSWELPFTVLLDDFTVERHPNTSIPRVFMSEVTKIEGHAHEKVRISMNKPLRHQGYTLFQATWGPQDAPAGAPLFSGFAVVRNPADHWPLYSCIVVAAGLLIHFMQKLIAHLRRRRA